MKEQSNGAPASGSSSEIDAARRDVARAHAKFNTDLEQVSSAGRSLTTSIVNGARPALIGVAAVTGVALIVAVWRWRAKRPAYFLRAGASDSPVGELGRAVVMTLASIAGRHIAARLVARSQSAPHSSSPAPATAEVLRRGSGASPFAPFSNGKY